MTNVSTERNGPIATLMMNRPERRNALSIEHMSELIAALRSVGDASVVVLAGAGPAFCAGHDLAELTGKDAAFYRQTFALCSELMDTIQSIPQPVIARVHGIATAAGCQLVATCDLAIAADTARFATPGVKIGLFCSTPMVALGRTVGRKNALEMLLTGDAIDAEEAARRGLINRSVSADRLDAEVAALAAKIATASPFVVGLGKQAFYRQLEMPQAAAYDYAQEVMALNALAADAQEGMCAFLEKREPTWTS